MDGDVAVILGAGGGIGAACCRAYAVVGRRVVAADLRLDTAAAALDGLPGSPLARAVDVTSPDAVWDLAAEAARLGPVSDLVYAPGRVMTAAVEDTDWRQYRALMAVNLDGAFFAAAAFAPLLKRQGHGAMVLISSTAGRRGEGGASHYCASKFGLIGLGESLAAELAPFGVRVNTVCPGNVDTPMLAQVAREIAGHRGRPEGDVWRELSTSGPARRLVAAEEVAAACVALAGPGMSAVTGATLVVDAGMTLG